MARRTITATATADTTDIDVVVSQYSLVELKAAIAARELAEQRGDHTDYVINNLASVDDKTLQVIFAYVRKFADPTYKSRYKSTKE